MAPKKTTKAAAATAAGEAAPNTPAAKPAEAPVTAATVTLPPVTPQEAVELVLLLTDPNQVPSLEQYGQLLSAIEPVATNTVPPHVRAKALIVVGNHGAQVESLLLKTASILVSILSAEDSAVVLQIGAITAITLIAAKLKTKQYELVRDMFDVLTQISMEENGFAPNVRVAAREAMNKLLEINFSGAFTKMLHLLSDERENDDMEYIKKERTLALDMLHHLVTAPVYGNTWTEEVQNHMLKFLAPVFPVVSADQFTRLAAIAAHLPIVKAKNGTNLVEVFMTGFKPESLRSFESLALLGPHIPRTATLDTLPAKLFPLVPTYISGEVAKPANSNVTPVAFAKALVLAARLCSEAAAGTYLPAFCQLVLTMPLNNFTIVEACCMSLSFLGHKNAAVALPLLHDEAFLTRMGEIHTQMKETKDKITVAIHKLVAREQATEVHGEAFACLSNIVTMTEAFAAKKLPTVAMQTSWDGRKALPRATPAAASGAIYQAKRGRS